MAQIEDPKTTRRNIAGCIVILIVFFVCGCLPAVGVPVYSLLGTQAPTTTEYVYPTNEPAPVYNTAIPQPTPNISQYIEPNSNKSWAETVKEMCKDGCVDSMSYCDIKANISFDTKEKIYHLPGDYFYNEVKISPEYGERWFCTEADAIRNGWRRSTQ